MRRLLGSLVLVPVLLAALTACGTEDDDVADEPAPTTTTGSTTAPVEPPTTATTAPTTTPDPNDPPTDDPTKSPPLTPGGVPFELLDILSATAGGGNDTGQAIPIATKAEADTYASTFSPDLGADVSRALTSARSGGQAVYAAVIAMGCDVPTGVDVSESDGAIVITATKIPDPTPECFAPVTSVAIVAITG